MQQKLNTNQIKKIPTVFKFLVIKIHFLQLLQAGKKIYKDL